MKSIIITFLLCFSLIAQTPLLENSLTFSSSGTSIALKFGIDPNATDGIDNHLNEFELPPLPPSNVFDIRFIGSTIGIDLGNGTLKDYRFGELPAQLTNIHEVFIQNENSDTLKIAWNFREGVTAKLADFFGGTLINLEMAGFGEDKITNLQLSNLKLTVIYNVTTRVLESNNAKSNLNSIVLYPNPFNNSTNIYITSEKSNALKLKLFNSIGKECQNHIYYLHSGENSIHLTLSKYASGIYYAVFLLNNEIKTCKLILTK